MRLLILVLLASIAFPATAAERCANGAIWHLADTDKDVLVVRQGYGKSPFTAEPDVLLPGTALEITSDILGAPLTLVVFGPTRSYNFVAGAGTGPEVLPDYDWEAPSADPDGFFRVLDGSGDPPGELFAISFVRCAT